MEAKSILADSIRVNEADSEQLAVYTYFASLFDIFDHKPDPSTNKPAPPLPKSSKRLLIQLSRMFFFLSREFCKQDDRGSEVTNIHMAIASALIAAHCAPFGHVTFPARLKELAIALFRRYKRLGELPDIDNSISAARRAIEHTRDGHVYMPRRLNQLSRPLAIRFIRPGSLLDLDDAVSTINRASILLQIDTLKIHCISTASVSSSRCAFSGSESPQTLRPLLYRCVAQSS
jgi:hypothetical protein